MASHIVSKTFIVISVVGLLIGIYGEGYASKRAGRGTVRYSQRQRVRPRPREQARPRPREQARPRPQPQARPRRRDHKYSQPRSHYDPHPHYHPRPHYHPHPWFGTVVLSPPAGYLSFSMGGFLYYYHAGIYYRRHPKGYVVVTAPVGTTIVTLPVGYTSIYIEETPYFYYSGAFYQHHPERDVYVVIPAPVGAVVPVLPAGYLTVYVHDIRHYVVGGVYYRPVNHSGDLMYEVVPPPNRPTSETLEIVPETLFTYSTTGQTPEQQARDHEECHLWAIQQSGFDPRKPSGQTQVQHTQQRLQDYNRAFSPCMQARNYTIQ